MRHIVSATDLSAHELNDLFVSASFYKRGNAFTPSLGGKILASVFYEPSTRTRFSFEAAMLRLGGQYISTENAAQFSSAAKGESLEDAIRVISKYGHVIVFRHSENGSAAQAARASSVPLVNGGDGTNEHPTQAYLDLFTIWEALKNGRLPNRPLRILFFGDNWRSRVVNSLARLLATHAPMLGIETAKITFAGPAIVCAPQKETTALLEASNISYEIEEEGYDPCDVAYVTRSQRERRTETDIEIAPARYVPRDLPEHAIIMHPLPRTEELPPVLDGLPQAHYFTQAENGLYVRMALLEFLLAR